MIRVPSGVEKLDEMTGGGLYRDSVILVSGATGTGKTLLATEFVSAVGDGETSVLFAFEESRQQLIRNAEGFGRDFVSMEREGRLVLDCRYPESDSIGGHLLHIRQTIERVRPTRVAIDSLSAIARVALPRTYRRFLLDLTALLKQAAITGLFTSTSGVLTGAAKVSEQNVSTLTDSIILLRYVEMSGRLDRGITVLKMRGSAHDTAIRRFTIDSRGMTIHEPFVGVSGILIGQPKKRLEVTDSAGEA